MKLSALALLASLCFVHGSPVARGLEARQTEAGELTDYVYVYFTGEGTETGEQVYMAVSNENNPGSWTTLKDGSPVLLSDVGTMGIRDPSLIVAPDRSKFYLIATDLKVNGIGWENDEQFTTEGSKSIVVWESDDLTTWSGPTLPVVSPENAGMTWAPDAIWDPAKEEYMVFWTSNVEGSGFQTLRSYTPDFKTFSPAESYVSLGMDNTIALDEGSGLYYMISKNGPGELIQQNVAESLEGPWTKVSEEIGSGQVAAGEGALIFQNNADPTKWHLWIDNYTVGGGYVPLETGDLASGQWTPSEGFTLPEGPRHGYVVAITAAEREALLAIQ